MTTMKRLKAGFKIFREEYFGGHQPRFEVLAQGQSPQTMIIACSDSRVDPAILTNSGPGEIFTVRNVANLVPPYEESDGYHGVSAALEFAVCNLRVSNIIVLGHSQCGGIGALLSGAATDGGDKFISHWMSIAAPARESVMAENAAADPATRRRAAEQAAVKLSLENLKTFPFVMKRLTEGDLALFGWYFDLESGDLQEYEAEAGLFKSIV
ncbi:MAG: carbonic anhydrase [Dehalogenimonas sp.]